MAKRIVPRGALPEGASADSGGQVTRLHRSAPGSPHAPEALPGVDPVGVIADNLPAVIFRRVTYPDGSAFYPYVSEGLRQFGGDPKAVMGGKAPIFDRIHPEDREAWQRVFLRSAETLGPINHAFRLIQSRGGAVQWLRVAAQASRRSGGEVVHDGIAFDVTNRIEAHRALQESEERFRNLIEGSIEGIAIVMGMDPVFVNQAFAEIFGFESPEAVLALGSARSIIHPDDLPRLIRYNAARLDGRPAPASYEFRGRRRDGMTIWVECKVRPVRWQGVEAVQVTLFDITARKEAEEELRKFRSIVEASGEAIAIAGIGGDVRYINPAYERLFGRRMLVGRELNVRDQFPPETMPTIDSEVVPALMRDGNWEGVLSAWHASGRRFPLWVRVATVRDATGTPMLNFGLMHDYSAEQKHRTELEAAKEAADAANRAKSKFLAAASHDMRQPLHALSAFLGALSAKVAGRELTTLIDQMEQALRSAQRLQSSVLDMSRLEAGVVSPTIVEFPIGELLKAMEVEFGLLASAAGLEFRVVRCSAVVRSDPDFLTAIARNLLSNAVTYTRRGRVLLGCRRRAGHIELLIGDTGPGIALEDQASIFEEFRRGEAGLGHGDGLGLGLAIVQRMAGLLGAKVQVRSALGRGAVFTIEVPLAQDSLRANSPPKATDDGLAGSRIVILSRPTVASARLSNQLENWRCEIAGLMRAKEAATFCRSGAAAPDVIIGDCGQLMTPSGLDVLDRLVDSWGGDIARIVILGGRSRETLRLLRERGIYTLQAPVEPARLRAVLSHAISEKRRRRASA